MRNLSVNAWFNQIAAAHTPRYRFAGSTRAQWQEWRAALLPQLLETLGAGPTRTEPNAETIVEWEEDGLLKRKIIFDVEPGLSATAFVFRPLQTSGKRPAILACHGHGAFGKDAVMGIGGSAERLANIAAHNYDYGLQMAKAGFVTMALDWRGFGERDDRRKPFHWDGAGGRDLCNLHYLRASVFGRTVLGMNLHDARSAIDYLQQQDDVDRDKIGVMGLSFGGTMATWIALTDDRIKAANVICYSDRMADFGIRDVNFCGSQITPGQFTLCDIPDLHGLIAPRPLLVEIGVADECFGVESAMSCWRETEKIYAAAGVSSSLELDLFPGGHGWGGSKSVAFFRRYLGNAS